MVYVNVVKWSNNWDFMAHDFIFQNEVKLRSKKKGKFEAKVNDVNGI